MNKKELVVRFRPLVELACRVHNLRNCFRTKKRGKNNRITAPCALLKKVRIEFSGNDNEVIIEEFAVLKNVSLSIHGSGNVVRIGGWSHLNGTEVCTENDGNAIILGQRSKLYGRVHLAAMEGTKITIGQDCLFSDDVHIRTGDSHSLLDMQGRRINASQDITLGDHVWVGTKVTCLKGSVIPPHCVVGAGSLVTKAFAKPNCAIAGVPAKVVREEVDWSLKRIPVGEIAADFQPLK